MLRFDGAPVAARVSTFFTKNFKNLLHIVSRSGNIPHVAGKTGRGGREALATPHDASRDYV
jgi:hypothetical protein